MKYISFATFNLYNLNEPTLPIYNDRNGWSQNQYKAKIAYTAAALKRTNADVFGFQELWHHKSLKQAFLNDRLHNDYDLVVPNNHCGEKIVCAAAIRKDLLVSEPQWIDKFPTYYKLSSQGDDSQSPQINVDIEAFSRPVLRMEIKPRKNRKPIVVFVCHFKSKSPARVYKEKWYRNNEDLYKPHSKALGSAISTIRRTAEATALRLMLTDLMKKTNTPVVVMGDINDGQHSNTLNIVTGQPNFLLSGLQTGGSDVDLYTAQTLQQYRSQRDVYYTHVFNNTRESLDHVLFSQEFYDNSNKRIWAFKALTINNDHLNYDNHKQTGTNDHGVVKVTFEYKPIKSKKSKKSKPATS